jgi:hypothetical protein
MAFTEWLSFMALVAVPILLVWALLFGTRLGDWLNVSSVGESKHPRLTRILLRLAALAALAIPAVIFLARPTTEGCEQPVRFPCDPYQVEAPWMPGAVVALLAVILVLLIAAGIIRRY